jgi:hypothetical protein
MEGFLHRLRSRRAHDADVGVAKTGSRYLQDDLAGARVRVVDRNDLGTAPMVRYCTAFMRPDLSDV